MIIYECLGACVSHPYTIIAPPNLISKPHVVSSLGIHTFKKGIMFMISQSVKYLSHMMFPFMRPFFLFHLPLQVLHWCFLILNHQPRMMTSQIHLLLPTPTRNLLHHNLSLHKLLLPQLPPLPQIIQYYFLQYIFVLRG